MNTCLVAGCAKPSHRRGWCSMHYERWRIHGDVGPTAPHRGWAWGEFLRLFAVNTDDCVVWPYGGTAAGYGLVVTDDGRRVYTHRMALELTVGPPPAGRFEAAHSCNNPPCMNARHLRWATVAENQADRLLAGTDHRGERHPRSVLTAAAVASIRAAIAQGAKQVDVARRHGVSPQLVTDIKKGRVWKSV